MDLLHSVPLYLLLFVSIIIGSSPTQCLEPGEGERKVEAPAVPLA